MVAPRDPAVLKAHGLCYAYPGVTALHEIDLDLRPGQMVALLGANGSGKTTLLKALVGLLKPQSGEVRLGGRPVLQIPVRERFRHLGLVLQDPADQVLAASVEQDIGYGPSNLGLNTTEIERRVDESLAQVGACHLRQRGVHELSHGEMRRVALAGVLAMRPEVLLLDEPAAGLDPQGEQQLIELLLQIKKKAHVAILVATHRVDLVPNYADYVRVMHLGQQIAQGTPAEIFAESTLLNSAGLRLPQIAELFVQLRERCELSVQGCPLTPEEAIRALAHLLGRSDAEPGQPS